MVQQPAMVDVDTPEQSTEPENENIYRELCAGRASRPGSKGARRAQMEEDRIMAEALRDPPESVGLAWTSPHSAATLACLSETAEGLTIFTSVMVESVAVNGRCVSLGQSVPVHGFGCDVAAQLAVSVSMHAPETEGIAGNLDAVPEAGESGVKKQIEGGIAEAEAEG